MNDETKLHVVSILYVTLFRNPIIYASVALDAMARNDINGWRRGAVASVVRRMNEVTLRRARLVLRWVIVFGRVGWGLTALLTQNRSYRACKFVGIFHSKL